MSGPNKKAKLSSQSQGSSSSQTNPAPTLQGILAQTQQNARDAMAAEPSSFEPPVAPEVQAMDAAFTDDVVTQIAQAVGAQMDCKLNSFFYEFLLIHA
jgi:hypothetical protein